MRDTYLQHASSSPAPLYEVLSVRSAEMSKHLKPGVWANLQFRGWEQIRFLICGVENGIWVPQTCVIFVPGLPLELELWRPGTRTSGWRKRNWASSWSPVAWSASGDTRRTMLHGRSTRCTHAHAHECAPTRACAHARARTRTRAHKRTCACARGVWWCRNRETGEMLGAQWLEPPWKLILGNKALLPLLWERVHTSLPFNITRDCNPSLLTLRGTALHPF